MTKLPVWASEYRPVLDRFAPRLGKDADYATVSEDIQRKDMLLNCWSHDKFWDKAKTFVTRALGEGRESPLCGFWASLSLELLARGALAKVHPALLADPSDHRSLLAAFGYDVPTGKKRQISSISMAVVLERCTVIIKEFTQDEVEVCRALADRRNEEVHSGGNAFGEYSARIWLADFYRVCQLLTQSYGKTLADFLGEEASIATEMIDATRQHLRGEVEGRLKRLGNIYKASGKAPGKLPGVRGFWRSSAQIVRCPACGSDAIEDGKSLGQSKPKFIDGDLVEIVMQVLPMRLQCQFCGLELRSHAEMHAAQRGGQYDLPNQISVHEYFADHEAEMHEYEMHEPDYSDPWSD